MYQLIRFVNISCKNNSTYSYHYIFYAVKNHFDLDVLIQQEVKKKSSLPCIQLTCLTRELAVARLFYGEKC